MVYFIFLLTGLLLGLQIADYIYGPEGPWRHKHIGIFTRGKSMHPSDISLPAEALEHEESGP